MVLTRTEVKLGTCKKEPAGRVELPIYRLRSGCLATWPYRHCMLLQKVQEEYSGRGLNSRPSACKADVITTRLPEHCQAKKECYTLGGT